MSEREHLVVALTKEVLGPRDGPHEYLPPERDPRDEYIVGVLAPELPARLWDDPDADVDEAIEEVSDDEQQSPEGIIIAPPSAFSPALDPKAQPRSIGLSFVVVSDTGLPTIDICTTWARYVPQPEGGWRREPHAEILTSIETIRHAHEHIGFDVDVYLRVRPQENGTYRVSIYLVNQRIIPEGQRPTTSDFVFQPQIRVRCCSGTHLQPVLVVPATDDELTQDDRQLAMLYHERAALARGHMCGATWAAIDPESLDIHSAVERPQAAPFVWTDRHCVSSTNQLYFSPADVRTEFLPCYPIEAPAVAWPADGGPAPELDPDVLAEIWDVNQIRAALEPLVEGYSSWIEQQQASCATLRPEWQILAQANLNDCRSAAQRIQEGIDWIAQDDNVRLAFCFANKAMAIQSQWSRNRVYPWRPFQLAFILLNVAALADPLHPDRSICDLLWFPTGGGKTEAYLGLAAFTLALRRRRALQTGCDDQGGGVSVLSRYTLRLLTIQQFRRALSVITACEYLRVYNLTDSNQLPGWRPQACPNTTPFLWGSIRFSAGLWVGGGVTPNNLHGFDYVEPSGGMRHVAGALEILQGVSQFGYDGSDAVLRRRMQQKKISAEGEPAQVLTCPVCSAWLAIPKEGLRSGQYTLHFMFRGNCYSLPMDSMFTIDRIAVDVVSLDDRYAPSCSTLSITFTVLENQRLFDRNIDRWWDDTIRPLLSSDANEITLLATRASRPGYVLSTYGTNQATTKPNTFEIFCPDPKCILNQTLWAEQAPLNVTSTGGRGTDQASISPLPARQPMEWQTMAEHARLNPHRHIAWRMPIPACTTDDQIYHRCPSFVIATVDKMARLAFEPKAGALFGNVTHYHARWGYYREGSPPECGQPPQTTPTAHPPGFNAGRNNTLRVPVRPFAPPELIIQDELHLLEGPLGSMVGLYETVVDALCVQTQGQAVIRPKYVASTATVRQAGSQVASLFTRQLMQFPPSALVVDDRFFARTTETHPLESSKAGRLYIAIAAPGKGAQTPIVRIWSALLQSVHERRRIGAGDELDQFWTLVGYFNALRELAGAVALYRQDIRERLKGIAGTDARPLADYLELSSRANSLALPGMLSRLDQPWTEDAVLATSMFGTGVDVDRLGLMVVHGQPKTTSAYIQATGRVGRQHGGLVVAFFRASRPRDLDHYEFFTGYHRMLYRAVEPITVTPYAPRARERGLGPIAVALLRQARTINGVVVEQPWHIQQRIQNGLFSQACLMRDHRHAPEVEALSSLFEARAMNQPEGRRPLPNATAVEIASELDRWMSVAHDCSLLGGAITDRLVYSEPSMLREPERGVILGDPQHQLRQLPVAFENAPTSLRDVEEATQFRG